MMISPETYREEHENDLIEELKKERKRLKREIWRLETGRTSLKERMTQPLPDTKKQMYKLYLEEIEKLIKAQ